MKNGMTTLIATGLLLGQVAAASEMNENTAVEYNGFNREDVKTALEVLVSSGAMRFPENQYPQIDEKLVVELKREGFIKKSGPCPSSICTDIKD